MKRIIKLLFIPLVIIIAIWFGYRQFLSQPEISVSNKVGHIHYSSMFFNIQKEYRFQEKRCYLAAHSTDGFNMLFDSNGELLSFDFEIAVEENRNRYDIYYFKFNQESQVITGSRTGHVPLDDPDNVVFRDAPAYSMFEIIDDYNPLNWLQHFDVRGDKYQVILWDILSDDSIITRDIVPEGYDWESHERYDILYREDMTQDTLYRFFEETGQLEQDETVGLKNPALVLCMIVLNQTDDSLIGSYQFNVVSDIKQ